MSVRNLRHLFEPTRILWVGPDQEPAPWARLAEANLWGHGFAGRISSLRSTGHAPAEARIETLADLPVEASLGVVCLPQADLPELLAALADRGCRAVNLIGGGDARFSLDAEQARAVRRAARRLGLRVVGPDRIGVIVPGQRLSLGAATTMPPAGDLAFVTQSDSIANAMLEWSVGARAGFSRIVSLGENAEVELGDILDYLALDPATRAVLVHLEGIADARRFLSAGRAVARIKPVLVLKAGRQIGPPPPGAGNVGIRLHRDQVYDAAFARAGLVRVGSIEELFAAASSLGAGAVRRGHGLRNGRLAVLTNGNGPAELAADALLAGGGAIVRPTPRLYDQIAGVAGDMASVASAVDLGPDSDGEAYAAALAVLLEAPDIDGVLVIHAPSAGVDATAVATAVAAAADRRKPRSTQRPVLAAWLGGASERQARAVFETVAIPMFATPEAAVRAFLHRVQHERRQFVLRQIPTSRPEDGRDRVQRAQELIGPALAAGRRALGEPEQCRVSDPALQLVEHPDQPGPVHQSACHFSEEIDNA